jgi:hypothetical protein
MSLRPDTPLSPVLLTMSQRSDTQMKSTVAGLTVTGVLLFLIGFLVVGSGYSMLRPKFIGLSMHPYLIPVGFAFPLVLMARMHRFPLRIGVSILVFVSTYSFSALNGGLNPLGEVFKVASAVISIVVCALLVRRRGDFVAGALGLAIAVAALGMRGLQPAQMASGEIMDGANKNSYSIFALPAILLAGFIVLHFKTVPKIVKAALIVCILPALAVIFMGGNRSGYLGAVIVAAMLFWDQRGKGLLLIGGIVAVVAVGIAEYGSTKILNERLKQTVEGNRSDNIRRDILIACAQIALENPIIGVGPQKLPLEIAGRLPYATVGYVEAHNVFAHVMAGSGLICFGAMLTVGWTLCTWRPRRGGTVGGKEDPLRDARKLMRMLIVLWVVRGFFTPEIIYNPAFDISIGLVIGYCMLTDQAGAGERLARARIRPAPAARGGLAASH